MCRLYHRFRSWGGKHGGQLVAAGTPEDIAKNKKSVTGKYLQEKL